MEATCDLHSHPLPGLTWVHGNKPAIPQPPHPTPGFMKHGALALQEFFHQHSDVNSHYCLGEKFRQAPPASASAVLRRLCCSDPQRWRRPQSCGAGMLWAPGATLYNLSPGPVWLCGCLEEEKENRGRRRRNEEDLGYGAAREARGREGGKEGREENWWVPCNAILLARAAHQFSSL